MLQSLERMLHTLIEHSVFLLLVLPLVGAVLVAMSAQLGTEVVRRTALTNVLLSAALAAVMVANYAIPHADGDQPPRLLQMASESSAGRSSASDEGAEQSARGEPTTATEIHAARWAVRIAVGVDGVSLWFVAAVSLLMIPAVIADWNRETRNPAVFFVLILVMQSALVGLFAALDVVLFCVCAEVVTLLMFLLLGAWGGADRRRVAQPFFHYQRLGSMLVFFGIVALITVYSWGADAAVSGERAISFSITRLTTHAAEWNAAGDSAGEHWQMMRSLIVLPLMFGFAIKASLFPLHRWLPTAQTESPTAVAIVLCGVSVNVGIYGFVRFLLPVIYAAHDPTPHALATWALLSTVVAGFLALAQGDFRRMVAYAVVGHAGLCVAGVFSMNAVGVAGGVLRAVSQGLCLGGLAFLLGGIRRRYDTFEIKAFGGLIRRYPRLGILFVLMVLATVAVPGTGGFAGGLAVLSGIFKGPTGAEPDMVGTVAALCGLLLVSAAMIWMMQRVVFGPFREPVIDLESFATPLSPQEQPDDRGDAREGDLSGGECATLVPLLAVVLWMGLAPQFFLDRIVPSVQRFLPSEEAVQETRGIHEQSKFTRSASLGKGRT